MATHTHGTAVRHSAAATGWTVFAGIVMVFAGVMAVFQGIAAIANDDVFVTTRNYTFEWNLTGWGWLHLILGVVIATAGVALFSGATWARIVGITVAGLSMLANFIWLPWYPLWAITLIIVDGFVIWALSVGPARGVET